MQGARGRIDGTGQRRPIYVVLKTYLQFSGHGMWLTQEPPRRILFVDFMYGFRHLVYSILFQFTIRTELSERSFRSQHENEHFLLFRLFGR